MKRVVGIFLSLSALLTYQIVDVLYYPVEEKIIDNNSGITTVIYNYPLMYRSICTVLIITFILGIYFILAKEKQRKESISCDS
ncbi:hypothetical protein LF817_09310 [Halobacillus sp. A1]|uniref:hypothetical protein n=1 Tax=Halobacillus sp. A1 TaxID=2880262 RepID=UPI0020A6C3AC|nr:hypothetical protein [Halobacillus sp. A1]MCP3031546.1 hypothetical protein [Halobacillus sp. A1]